MEWVYAVSNQPAPVAGSPSLAEPHVSRSAARRRAAQLAKRTGNQPVEPDTVRTGFQHLANQVPGRAKDEAADMNPAEATAVKTPAEKTPSEKSQPAAESDPFDPQAFNDRYLKAPGE